MLKVVRWLDIGERKGRELGKGPWWGEGPGGRAVLGTDARRGRRGWHQQEKGTEEEGARIREGQGVSFRSRRGGDALKGWRVGLSRGSAESDQTGKRCRRDWEMLTEACGRSVRPCYKPSGDG